MSACVCLIMLVGGGWGGVGERETLGMSQDICCVSATCRCTASHFITSSIFSSTSAALSS